MFYKSVILYITILFINSAICQEPPVWINNLRDELFSLGVSEDTRVGTRLGRLNAEASDGGRILYSTTTPEFIVDERSGEVTLGRALDFETQDGQVDVYFKAEDSVGNTVRAQYVLTITDVNDNPPVFQEGLNVFYISEDARGGTTVPGSIIVDDLDSGVNGELQFTCNDDLEDDNGCDVFEVSAEGVDGGARTEGRITLRRGAELDAEVEDLYTFTVIAEDGGRPTLSSTTRVQIHITDIQDTPPIFINPSTNYFVRENLPTNIIIGYVRARDGDINAEIQNPIEFRLEDDNGFFTIGDVTLQRGVYVAPIQSTGNIDAEAIPDNFVTFTIFAIEVIEGEPVGAVTLLSVTATIEDDNDNGPEFSRRNYQIEIPEALPEGSPVPGLDLTVEDADQNAYSEFELSSSDGYGVFTVSPRVVQGSAAINLIVVQPTKLDYEIEVYRRHVVTIVARETTNNNPRSSTATVTLNVRNENDENPKLSQGTYDVTMREDRERGHRVIEVFATDDDVGEYGELTFSLQGTGSENFNMNPRTGVITLQQPLSYEDSPTLSMIIQVEDGGGREDSAQFILRVEPVNSDGPQFLQDLYNTQVREQESRLSPPIRVNANGGGNRVTYSIVEGNSPDSAFSVDPNTGDVTMLRPVSYNQTPDRRGYFELIIEASVVQLIDTSLTTVRIEVIDINDNEPDFDDDTYSATVSEIAPPGTSVVTVSATDLDAGQNADITYSIAGSLDEFNIHYLTGVISVAGSARLNQDNYRITVRASDRGQPPLSSDVDVRISVLDANNLPPSFPRSVYLESVAEDSDIGTTLITLRATDPDDTADIRYTLDGESLRTLDSSGNEIPISVIPGGEDYLSINERTGAVTTNELLNRNLVAEFTFTVVAIDRNTLQNYPDSDSAEVIMTVRGTEDTGVIFTAPNWTPTNDRIDIQISESTPRGNTVYTLSATDADGDSRIQYRKIALSDPDEYFNVNPTTGQVTLARNVDYDILSDVTLECHVEAFKVVSGQRSTARAVLVATILDVNDNAPTFSRQEYRFNVREDLGNGGTIGQVSANDIDSGEFGTITYGILPGYTDIFFIHQDTGIIRLRDGVELDYERQSEFALLVSASDPSHRQTVTVRINVQDVNDNSPTFPDDIYNIVVYDITLAGVAIHRAIAIDDDSGDFGDVTYEMSPDTNRDPLFQIDPDTGVISPRVNLLIHARDDPYTFIVTATDNGRPPRSDDTEVNIYVYVTQVVGGEPQIVDPPTENQIYSISEDSRIGTPVTQILAIDDDGGEEGRLSYSFSSHPDLQEFHRKFNIDSVTGEITTAVELDREEKPELQVIVVVSDHDSPPNSVTRSLLISLEDVDDNEPNFDTCPNPIDNPMTVATKNLTSTSVITTIEACDRDSSPAARRNYYFITCGDDPANNIFYLDVQTGELRLYRELREITTTDYFLCIRTATDPNLDYSQINDNYGQSESQMLSLHVQIRNGTVPEEGPDDRYNLGDFGARRRNNIIYAVMSSDADYRTLIVELYIADQRVDDRYIYILRGTTFTSRTGEVRDANSAFKVDSDGDVYSEQGGYQQYSDGYFNLTVTALDQYDEATYATVIVSVENNDNRIKFIFSEEKDYVQENNMDVFEELQTDYFDNTNFVINNIQQHRVINRKKKAKWTDVCFTMITDNSTEGLDASSALDLFESDKFDDLFDEYDVAEVDFCTPHMTTTRWSGHSWLWWLLIVLAIIIFIITLLLILLICCIWRRYKNYMTRNKPYVVIDTGDDDFTPPRDYEWQEDTMKMD